MRNFRSVIPLAGAMAASMMLTACMDESPWGSTSKETGTIDITLTADYSFDTSKPVFTDDTRAEDKEDITSYLSSNFEMPQIDDFSIRLVKADNSFDKTWTSITAFKTDAADGFAVGSYTLTAFYGNVEDASYQGFDMPCFSASSTFTVLPGRESKIELTPTLANSMVVFEYSDAFKQYMASYNAKLKPKNAPDSEHPEILFEQNETRAAFIQPYDAEVKVSFTTKVTGKTQTASVEIGKFAPQPRTLHKIKFDVKNNTNGFAQLTLTYDETLEESFEPIDLTNDLYTTPEPVVTVTTPSNFVNGKSYNILTGSSEISSFKMNVVAKGGISKVEVSVTKDGDSTFKPAGWTNSSIDIFGKSASELQALNLVGNGFDNTAESNVIASLDVSDLINSLPQDGSSVYTLTFSVTDKKGQTCKIHDAAGNKLTDADGNDCESVIVVLNAETVTAALAKDKEGNSLSNANFCATEADVTIDFTGNNPQDVSFEVETSPNHYESVTSSWVTGQKIIGTRAFESQQCTYKLSGLPAIKNANIKLRAVYESNVIANLTIPVNLPKYQVSVVDAFAHSVYLKVIPEDSSLLSAIMENLRIEANDEEVDFTKISGKTDMLLISGLKSNSTQGNMYTINSALTQDQNCEWTFGTEFTTEVELPVPNGTFESLDPWIKEKTIQQGGGWTTTTITSPYYTKVSMTIDEPENWTTSNSITCHFNQQYTNSWYDVPSVYNTTLKWLSIQPKTAAQGEQKITPDVYKIEGHSGNSMVIRTVAWDDNGKEVGTDRKIGNSSLSNYYCEKIPTISYKTAGYLKLGSDGNGVSFTSRPVSLKGVYMYKDSQDNTEHGLIKIKVTLDNGVIGTGQKELSSKDEYTSFNVEITYNGELIGSKANKLEIEIYSSDRPTESLVTKNYCNKLECCSRGASLYIDDLTFEY